MKTISRYLAMLLALALLVPCLGMGIAQSELSFEEQLALDAQNPITFTVLLPADLPPAPDASLLAELARRTGVTLDITTIPGDPSEKIGMILASNSLPDIVCVPTGQMVNQYRDSGLVLDIMPYLQRSAPTVYDLFTSKANHNVMDTLMEPDGSLYGLANEFDLVWTEDEIIEDPNNEGMDYIWYPWSTALYVQYPQIDTYAGSKITTREGWYKAMQAFKADNPGDYALTMHNAMGEWLLYGFAQMNGYKVQTIGGMDYGANFITTDGEKYESLVRMPEALENLKFLNKLYLEGLMDPEGAIQPEESMIEKMSTGRVFSYLGWCEPIFLINDALFENEESVDAAMIPQPITATGNEKRWETNTAPQGTMTMMINKDCTDPDRLFRFFEYLFTDEGMILNGWGIEGEHYVVDESGKLIGTYDDTIIPPEDIGMDFFQQMIAMPYHLRDGQMTKLLRVKYEDEGLNDTIAMISETPYNYYRDFSGGYWVDIAPINILFDGSSDENATMAKIRTPINDMVCKAVMASSEAEVEQIYNDTLELLESEGLSDLEAAIQAKIDSRRN